MAGTIQSSQHWPMCPSAPQMTTTPSVTSQPMDRYWMAPTSTSLLLSRMWESLQGTACNLYWILFWCLWYCKHHQVYPLTNQRQPRQHFSVIVSHIYILYMAVYNLCMLFSFFRPFFLEFSYCSCNWHEFKSSLWWPHIQVTFLRDWEPGFEVFESLQLSCPCTLLCSLALQSTWLPGVESPLRSVRSNWQMRAAQISALFCKYINVKVKLHWVCHYCHSFNC